MSSWHSYPSTYQIGHPALAELFADPVLVEEKVDGSQFSFGVFWFPKGSQPDVAVVREEGDQQLALLCRSKGSQLNLVAPEKMFRAAVDTALRLAPRLCPGWTYRAEYLARPKHNALAYDRVPAQHLIVFDVNTGEEQYLTYDQKVAEVAPLGLEVVPRLFEGVLVDKDLFRELLGRTSVLGGQKVEGIVVKNYARFGRDKKALIGKYVSEAFKEVHAAEWKQANPGQGDVVQLLVAKYRTPARWAKARQHLAEAGQLSGEMKDIGLLIREVPEDVERECREEILRDLWMWAWPKVRRGICAGLPEWFKEEMLKEQFASQSSESQRGE